MGGVRSLVRHSGVAAGALAAASVLALAMPGEVRADSGRLSVLYFDNLSGRERHAYLGKALADMVISDLAQVKGVTLIERAQLEALTKELALGLTGLVDESTAPKVGKMLGADHLVTGTYLITRRDLKVTYRMLSVESGAILTAGTIDGNIDDVTNVKNQIVKAVVAKLGEQQPSMVLPKPAVAEKPVGLDDAVAYGQALDCSDHGDYEQARTVLKGLIGKTPAFRYAAGALSDVEKRIAQYDKEREDAIKRQRAQPLTWQSFTQLAVSYTGSMQYTKLLQLCADARKAPPEAPSGSITTTKESIDYYSALSLYMLKRWEEAEQSAESFLKNYPSSMYYGSVKMYLAQILNEVSGREAKRKRAEEQAGPLIAQVDSVQGAGRDLLVFRIAMAYFGQGVYPEALTWFMRLNITKLGEQVPGDAVLLSVFMCYYNLQNKAEATKVLKTVETFYPQSSNVQTMRSMLSLFPE